MYKNINPSGGHLYSKVYIMLEYKNTEIKGVVFQGEAHTTRVVFRVSKTAEIKKRGMFFQAYKNMR